jgi:hypothetical protein
MKKLSLSDIQNVYEYEKIRNNFRQRIIDLKHDRRIPVGDRISFVFENRETVKFQIQEMMRAERIVDDEKIREEIDVYNELLPNADELGATMFIEITEQSDVKPELDRFQGLDRGDCVYFEFGDLARVFARFEAGHSKEDRISAVHYLRFAFTSEEQSWFRDPKVSVALVVNHPHYSARSLLNQQQRASLAADFDAHSLAAERLQ